MGTLQHIINELFKRGPFFWLGGGYGGLVGISDDNLADIYRGKTKTNGPCLKAWENALQITCQSLRSKIATENWIPKPEFCVAHRSILSLCRESCAHDISC